MVKQILEDTFEKLVEHGQKAGKTAVQSVKPLVSASNFWSQMLGVDSSRSNESNLSNKSNITSEVNKGKNHTPLNFDKLGKSYQDSEKQKTEILKNRLFQMVKSGEEKNLYEKKKEEEEKKRKEVYETQQKQQQEIQRKRQQESDSLPRGKIRRSIFSHKKVAERSHTETKPATGKQ